MTNKTDELEVVGPSGDSLSDFREGQWWLCELDSLVEKGTPDQKRAVAVVRNLMASAQAALAAAYQSGHNAGVAHHKQAIQKRITQLEAALVVARVAFERIACLGNGNVRGNSVGNTFAIDTLTTLDRLEKKV